MRRRSPPPTSPPPGRRRQARRRSTSPAAARRRAECRRGRRRDRRRTAVEVDHPQPPVGGGDRLDRGGPFGDDDSVAAARRGPGGQRKAQHLPSECRRWTARTASGHRSPHRRSAARAPAPLTHAPPACPRMKICHSPPSPFCTWSMTHRPSAEAVRKFSAIRSSAKTPDSSGRSPPPASPARGTRPPGRSPGHVALARAAGGGSTRTPLPSAATRGPAGGTAVHPRDLDVDLVAGLDVVDVQGAVLGAVLRQRHGDQGAVGRRDVPIDRRRARLVERVGVDQHPLAAAAVDDGEHDEEALLGAAAAASARTAGRRRHAASRRAVESTFKISSNRRSSDARRQRREIGAVRSILRLGPSLCARRAGVLQPAVLVGHLDTVVHRRHRLARRVDLLHGRSRYTPST